MGANDQSAFDLRMACLGMAKDLLSERMHMQDRLSEKDKTVQARIFTSEDVLTEAARFYAFVCDKNAAVTYAPKG